MPHAVIVIGAVEGVRRRLEGHLERKARLWFIRLVQRGGYRLEPHPRGAVQMLEAALDYAVEPSKLLVVLLPYAQCPDQVSETIDTLAALGASVLLVSPGAGRWPSRPRKLDGQFERALLDALTAALDNWLPSIPPPLSVEDAIARARSDFADTLHIRNDLTIITSCDGPFWYSVMHALHYLCLLERSGQAHNKRDLLRDRLSERIGAPKRTFKIADTGLFTIDPASGKRIQLRERVHLVEGSPANTESVYWATIGEAQASYRYLIGHIGRHA
jgi:hypothetical protein